MRKSVAIIAGLLSLPVAATPVQATGPVIPVTSWFGMVFFLFVLAGVAHFVKKKTARSGGQPMSLRVVNVASLGGKERVAVVEIGDQWFVLGVAPGSVTAIGSMPAQRNEAGEQTSPAQRPFKQMLESVLKPTK